MTRLKPYQLEGARGIYRFKGRALLADEQGLGKTIQALYWVRKTPRHRPVVVVTPASVKYVWRHEAQTHFGMKTIVLEGFRPKRVMNIQGEGDIVVLNYEILKSWLPALLRLKPQVVILDEVHYISSPTTKRTKATWKLCDGVPSVVGLSGTPFTNRTIELWSVLQAIKPELFPEMSVFAWRYTKPFHWRGRWHYKGSKNSKELHGILRKNVMIRRLKKEVLPDLPPKSRILVPFRISDLREYNQAEKHFIRWLHTKSPARAKRAKKSQALTKIGYLVRLAAKIKLRWTERWIQDWLKDNPDKKLVVLSMHTDVIRHVYKRFNRIAVKVDGSVSGQKRVESVRKFQGHRGCRLFVGHWKAAGIGLTLTASNVVAALDLPWTSGDMVQGEDRIHRIGQKLKCFIYYLVALGTIEEKQLKILKEKSAVLAAILDGRRSTKDLDLFEELMRELK